MAKKPQKKFDIKSGEPAELNPYKDELKMEPVLTPEKGQHEPDARCMVLPAFPPWGCQEESPVEPHRPRFEENPVDIARKEYGWAEDNVPALLLCILGEMAYARRHK